MSSGGVPFLQQRTGEQASTEHATVYRGSPAHRPLLIMEISPRRKFPLKCGSVSLPRPSSFSSRISRTCDRSSLNRKPECMCASTPILKIQHILLHRWQLKRFRRCVFQCEFAIRMPLTELAPTPIQHLVDLSQLIIILLSPCRVIGGL